MIVRKLQVLFFQNHFELTISVFVSSRFGVYRFCSMLPKSEIQCPKCTQPPSVMCFCWYRSCLFAALLGFCCLKPGQAQPLVPPQTADLSKALKLMPLEGLVNQDVLTVFQDRKGFMWIGAINGLHRFDGHRLLLYQHLPGDSTTLPNNAVNEILETRDGTLWLGTNNGLCRLDRRTEHFYTYPMAGPNENGLQARVVIGLQEDSQGRLWIATYGGGLEMLNVQTGRFEHLTPKPYRDGDYLGVSKICPDRKTPDAFWINIYQDGEWGFYRFDTRSKTFSPFPAANPLRKFYLWAALEDRNGQLWLTTRQGPKLLDRETGVVSDALGGRLSGSNTMEICEDRAGLIWLGTSEEGLYAHDPKTGSIAHYSTQAPPPFALSDNTINGLYQDRSGVIWICTFSKGIDRLVPDLLKFTSLRSSTGLAYDGYTSDIWQDHRGTIWLALESKGLGILDRAKKSIQVAPQTAPGMEGWRATGVMSCLEDSHKYLWVGGNGSGLFRLSPNRDSCVRFVNNPADSTSLSENHITAVLEDKKGRMWFANLFGVDRYDQTQRRFIHYPSIPTDAQAHYNPAVVHLLEDQHGRIWASSEAGLARLDEASATWQFIIGALEPSGKTRCGVVIGIFETRDGTIWAETEKGLCRLRFEDPANPTPDRMVATFYTERDGLSHNAVVSILEDDHGRLWCGTKNGISVFLNPQHGPETQPVFKIYRPENGLQSPEFGRNAAFRNGKGEFIFGGTTGVNIFHPDSIPDNPHLPPLEITSLTTFDKNHPELGAVSLPGASTLDEVVLSYRNNLFYIQFAALDFRDPSQHRYAYRLEGFQNRWVYIGQQNEVTFTNLDPGTYLFQVKGTNNDGLWSDTPRTLRIVITPPWWKTWWAYSLYLALALGGIYAFVRFRVRFLQQRNRELEQAVQRATGQIRDQNRQLALQAESLRALDEVKSRFFANVSHELRTPLTLILGPLSAVLNRRNLPPDDAQLLQIAQKSGQGLVELVGEILDLGKLEAGRLTLHEAPVKLQTTFLRLVGNFDSYAQRLGVRYEGHCDILADVAALLDRKKFETILNNLLSNAFKFTPAGGSIEAKLSQTAEGRLLLSVRDTGRGIHPDDLPHVFERYFQSKQHNAPTEGGTGIGLALCSEYARLFEGRIWAESDWGKGSVFFFEIPYKPAAEVEQTESAPRTEAAPTQPLSAPPLAKTSVPTANPSLLMVEDNEHLQAFLINILSPHYAVTTANNGAEALAHLGNLSAQKLPDLILTDIMMPVMDGFQLLEALKGDARYRHLPVVVLTALADTQDRLRALRIGVDDYLLKPFEEEPLLARLEGLLRNARNRFGTEPEEEAPEQTPEATPPVRQFSADDLAWLEGLETLVLRELPNFNLSADMLADKLNISRPTFFRKVKHLTGLTVQQYIAEARYRTARAGLEHGRYTSVKSASLSVGLRDVEHFAAQFKERFGNPPSNYIKN